MNEFRLNPHHDKEVEKQMLDPYEHEKQRRLRPHQLWADQLIALAQGKLSDQQRAEVERHLNTCERCAEAYHAYREVSQLLRLAAPRKSRIKESGGAYDAAFPTKPRLPSVDMPPGIPRQMREYMEKYVVLPTPRLAAPGTQMNAFRTIQPLERDGLVEHHLAEHQNDGRHIRLHIVDAPLSQQEREVFQQEAQHLSDLRHPNIVPVVDYGVDNDKAFLALENIAAQSLRQRHRSGVQLPIATVVEYVQQVAQALSYAHQRGVVHRNIKPESLLSSEKTVHVSNFGLSAGALRPGEKSPEGGAYLAYTAPEELEGEHSAASDQYALGAVVYEWLTGNPPFSGSFDEVARQQQTTPPPSPRARRPDLPPRLDAVLRQALAKKPEQRHPTIQKFAEALIEAAKTVRTEN